MPGDDIGPEITEASLVAATARRPTSPGGISRTRLA
jgi:hypothetical protein